MSRKKFDIAKFTTEEALQMLLENVEADQKAARKAGSHTAVTTSNRLIYDIHKKIKEYREASPDAAATVTPYNTLPDDELFEAIALVMRQCPEHMLTRIQTEIDERRNGPALALVADAEE